VNSGLIPPSGKFAMLATSVHVTLDESVVELSNGVWISTSPLVQLDQMWSEWLGSIKTDQLKESSLIVWATSRSKSPSIFDQENQKLLGHVSWFWTGLQVATKFYCNDEPLLLSGGNEDGGINVRQSSNYSALASLPGSHADSVNIDHLRAGSSANIGSRCDGPVCGLRRLIAFRRK
jgi:hypothetical protein